MQFRKGLQDYDGASSATLKLQLPNEEDDVHVTVQVIILAWLNFRVSH